jgi:hypothetical protein
MSVWRGSLSFSSAAAAELFSSTEEGVRVDQGKAEFLGFLALAVVLPAVAALRLARPIGTPFAAFAAIVGGSAALSTAAGVMYGMGLKLALGRPEINWSESWFLGGIFGGIAGFGCGALRAAELVCRRGKAPGTAPDRMNRRWVVLVAVVVLGVGVVEAVWVGQRSQGLTDQRAAGVNAGNFHRIQVGMSAEEVNGIFGVPPGDYSRPRSFQLVGPGHIPWTEAARGGRLAVWYGLRYHAEVLYNRNGCVVGKYWYDAEAKK